MGAAFLAAFFAAFLADFFGAAFLAFFADFLTLRFADFFAAIFFFLAFLAFFFFALAIVVLLLPPIHVHQALKSAAPSRRARSQSSRSWPWTARRPIEKLNSVHDGN